MLEPISVRAGGQGNCCKGGEVERKGESVIVGGGLPVALAPTGSNLEQTAPSVFIRLWLGWTQVGRAAQPDAE